MHFFFVFYFIFEHFQESIRRKYRFDSTRIDVFDESVLSFKIKSFSMKYRKDIILALPSKINALI